MGLVTQAWRGWAADLAKATAIAAGPAGRGARRRRRALDPPLPRAWWLPAAAAVGRLRRRRSLSLAPVVLDPIFNRFTPLPDGETRDDVLALAARRG